MQTASIPHQVDLERLSFKGALDTLNRFADAVHSAHGKPRRQAELLDAMFELIVQDQLPIRPGRSEPRVQKRHPKAYPFLAKPVAKCVLLPTILSESNPYLLAPFGFRSHLRPLRPKESLATAPWLWAFSQKDLEALIWSR
jgi:hypothetical protein